MKPEARDGVPPSCVRAGAGPHADVLAFLQARFPAAPDWLTRLQAGEVLDARGQSVQAHASCPPGTLLWYWRRSEAEARVPFELRVLHQCEHLVVVDKPPFLSVTPAGRHVQETVLVRLRQQLGLDDLTPLHRLDRDTAGVLALAVQPATRAAYQALWRERLVHKVYEAIAPWRDDLSFPFSARHRLEEPRGQGFMQMQVVDGEPNAETWVECLHELAPDAGLRLALYRLTPRTGRKHQLRAQMAALGLPLVNDRIYPSLQPLSADDYERPLMLLARSLRFVDPIDGREHCFKSTRSLEPTRTA